jgi:membrane protein implicated in regulation of membrane protease activity
MGVGSLLAVMVVGTVCAAVLIFMLGWALVQVISAMRTDRWLRAMQQPSQIQSPNHRAVDLSGTEST